MIDPNKPRNHKSLTGKCAPRAWPVLVLLVALASPSVVHADSAPGSSASSGSGLGPVVATEQSSARLLSGVTGVGALAVLPAGVEIQLKPGWKTYWRSPGDAGFPPQLTFDGSVNVASATLAYPTPHRFELFGLETFGYKQEVVYPIAVTPLHPGQAISLRGHLRYLVCAQVCIPYEAELALDIPAGTALPSDQAPLMNHYRAMVPGDGRGLGLALDDVRIDAAGRLVVQASSDGQAFTAPDLLVEGPNSLNFGKPDVVLAENGSRATLTLPIDHSIAAGQPVVGDLTLTLTDGERGLEEKARLLGLNPGPLMSLAPDAAISYRAPHQAAPVEMPLLLILGIAVMGGLILNVMPCVLPVLILKLTSVLAHGGGEGRAVRLSFLATAGGIVAAFLALATVLVGLKLAGLEIGWGIQFQQPLFLAVLAGICLVFAANLWGWFEVPLPAMAGDLALAAESRLGRKRMLGAFMTGVFATVLATPCSAPFVGTAIGFALARGGGEIYAIFLALAIGLALPYLAVAAVPHLAVMLPRPGRWMIGLKKLLGLSMAATAAWLVWVLAGQVGILRPIAPAEQAFAGPVHWQAFDRAQIPQLVASGKTVFVDVTADWCLTCKANKALVVDREPVSTRLNQDNIVAMEADWTRPNPAIGDYLASFSRYGIPLNVVYGPKAPEGIALTELLTSAEVIAALHRASGG